MRAILLLAAISIAAAAPTSSWEPMEELRSILLQQDYKNRILSVLENMQQVIKDNDNTVAKEEQVCVPRSITQYFFCNGTDDRMVRNKIDIPYKWICRLKTKNSAGTSTSFGTGFMIKISPDVGRTVIMTAAHVLRKGTGRYVDKVEVYCPGREMEVVNTTSGAKNIMWIPDISLNHDPKWFHDYGFLTISGNSNTGFGWSAYYDESEMRHEDLYACGYPQYKRTCAANDDDTLYCGVGKQNSTYLKPCGPGYQGTLRPSCENWLKIDIDMDSGQSGGPLYAAINGNTYTVFGIVSIGGCPGRTFQRLTAEKIHNVLDKLGYNLTYKIRATKVGKNSTYLHINTTNVQKTYGSIGGRVYLRKYEQHDLAKVKIYPVRQTSSNVNNEQLKVIRSGTKANTFLRMDAANVNKNNEYASCTVNCRYGIDDGKKEVFHVENHGQQTAFRSRLFDKVYLRLNWWEVKYGSKIEKSATCHYGNQIDGMDTHTLVEVP